MRKILEENGAGVEPVPELDYVQEIVSSKTPPKKRARESSFMGEMPPHGMPVPRLSGPSPAQQHVLQQQQMSQQHQQMLNQQHMLNNGHGGNGNMGAHQMMGNNGGNNNHMHSVQQVDAEDILSRVLERISKGFDDMLEAIRATRSFASQEHADFETRRRAMEELNSEKYAAIMSNAALRDRVFLFFKDAQIASDFLLYPEAYREHFLDDLLTRGIHGFPMQMVPQNAALPIGLSSVMQPQQQQQHQLQMHQQHSQQLQQQQQQQGK